MHLDTVTLARIGDCAGIFFDVCLGMSVVVAAGTLWWSSRTRPEPTARLRDSPHRWLSKRAQRMVLAELRAADGCTLSLRKLVDRLGVKLVLLVVDSMRHRIPDTELRLDLSGVGAGDLRISIVGAESDSRRTA